MTEVDWRLAFGRVPSAISPWSVCSGLSGTLLAFVYFELLSLCEVVSVCFIRGIRMLNQYSMKLGTS